MRNCFAVALAWMALGAAPATSAVVTTGCADTASCTLSELFANGSIQVDDVLFDGFVAGTNFGVDPGAVTVAGSSFSGDALLAFTFMPPLAVQDGDAAEFDFDYTASVEAPSTRQVDSAVLNLLGAGVATGFSFAEVNTDIAGELLTVDLLAGGGGDTEDAVSFAAQSFLSLGTDFQIEADDDGSASLSQFLLTLSLEGDHLPDPAPIPLPAGAPLFLAALGAFALVRRL